VARVARRLLGWLLFVALVGGAYLFGRDHVRRYPQDVPWTDLDLQDPIGPFTGRKLATLADDPRRCLALLTDAGIDDVPAPARSAGAQCGYSDGVRLGSERLGYRPSGLVTACPVSAALALLEREVIDLAAVRHFGVRATAIDHAGSYNCRRLYGRAEGPFSAHATADAVDLTGFRLAGGKTISVLRDWHGNGPEAAFLREVRDGACRLFATVLSPDYNAAHADHLHLEQANRGAAGWRACR
jgi:hypothetical protein